MLPCSVIFLLNRIYQNYYKILTKLNHNFTEVKITSSNFMSDRFRDFSLVFFPLIESEISEQANRQIAAEEPKKDL